MAEPPAPTRLTLAGGPELRRYSRHLLIPQVGLAGQERLRSARVLVVGAGGLGSPVLQYLAAAGVGRIGVVDDDTVDETNLQRQTIFATADIGKPKAQVAAQYLHALNPLIAIDPIPVRFDTGNARELVRLYDVIADCTDRFSIRYLINDACMLEGKPDVYASIFRFDGQISVFGYRDGPCYRCLYADAPPPDSVPTCAEGGVLGVLAGLVGTWQANEVLKLLLGIGEPLAGRLLLVESLSARTREVRFARDPSCALCGEAPTIFDALESTVDELRDEADLEPAELDDALADAVLLDVREPHEAVLGLVEGALHIPASQLEERMHELDSARHYVVACRVGAKSHWAARRLRDAGFTRVRHLRGGLLAYAAAHDSFDFF
ncbi:MAG TPA: molybdopterin-synthase adenylyltransferase MoeB [Candidatus Baltobacteraceae bacterium]|nr:molybdopterin-synthase adenylyltransferase MoeB [Candidatus Baltobacteraceae bacterium]